MGWPVYGDLLERAVQGFRVISPCSLAVSMKRLDCSGSSGFRSGFFDINPTLSDFYRPGIQISEL